VDEAVVVASRAKLALPAIQLAKSCQKDGGDGNIIDCGNSIHEYYDGGVLL